MLDAAQMAIAFVALLGGSVVLATVGFGIGLTASPLLLLVMDPQSAVVLLNAASVAVLAPVMVQTRADLPVREMTPVAVAGALGVPLGVVVLSSVNADALRTGIAGLVLLLAFAVALNVQGPARPPQAVGVAVGFLVGALIAGLAIGGPLIVLFLLGRGLPRAVVRASTTFYYLVLAITAVVGYAIAGLFTPERVALILIVSPAVVLGFGLASLLVRRMNERRFRQGVLGIIMTTSLAVLAQELLRIQGYI